MSSASCSSFSSGLFNRDGREGVRGESIPGISIELEDVPSSAARPALQGLQTSPREISQREGQSCLGTRKPHAPAQEGRQKGS